MHTNRYVLWMSSNAKGWLLRPFRGPSEER